MGGEGEKHPALVTLLLQTIILTTVAVNSPGLSTGPAGVIGITLKGFSFHWLLSQGVKIEGVISAEIFPDNVLHQCIGMSDSSIAIYRIAGFITRPEEQGDILQGINDGLALSLFQTQLMGFIPGDNILAYTTIAA